jgi:hypothetical protein
MAFVKGKPQPIAGLQGKTLRRARNITRAYERGQIRHHRYTRLMYRAGAWRENPFRPQP